MREFVRRHDLLLFVLLAYAWSWADWLPLALEGAHVVPGGSVTHFPGLLGPALAAFLVVAASQGWTGVRALLGAMAKVSSPITAFLAYSFSPLVFLALAILVMSSLGQALPALRSFGLYSGLPPLWPASVLLLVLLFNGFGEEIGWRGFALERLQRRFGALRGNLLLALIWAGWHTPSFWFVQGYRELGPWALLGGFGFGILCGSMVLARVANRTGGSVLAVAIWHATYNFTSATSAGHGFIGAFTTTCVMVWAGVLMLQEWRWPLRCSRLSLVGVDRVRRTAT
jgi:uncharacterized protein